MEIFEHDLSQDLEPDNAILNKPYRAKATYFLT